MQTVNYVKTYIVYMRMLKAGESGLFSRMEKASWL